MVATFLGRCHPWPHRLLSHLQPNVENKINITHLLVSKSNSRSFEDKKLKQKCAQVTT